MRTPCLLCISKVCFVFTIISRLGYWEGHAYSDMAACSRLISVFLWFILFYLLFFWCLTIATAFPVACNDKL
ncbi:hypothetical protein BJY01DRAFT_37093 [Aspergillus pseudoustus]|uniref:Uncharacterized protein n=1 Tax=Aspergillus pseudoustus TaxID=1810923 RepID=A0ABR4KQ26_9EURO